MTDVTVHEESVTLMHPQTGEILELATAENAQIAQWIDSVREWESNARQAKQIAAAELHKRMDQAACWTLRDGEYEIRGESPERIDYDSEALLERLTELVESEAIAPEAADAALKREVSYKPAKRGINALLKLGGKVADAIKACEQPVERPRRITVKRST